MLQDMREKAQSWVAKAIVAFIAFTFAIFGLESLRPNSNNPEVAKVDGEKITQQDLFEAMDQQRRMLVQQMGNNFDPSMLDERLLQQAALESLIQRVLIRKHLENNNMVVSEQSLDNMIRTTPEFQVDGRYDADRLMQIIRSLGMTVSQFRGYLREEMAASQLRAGIAGSDFMTTYEVQALGNLQSQTRDISWMTLEAEQARKAVKVSEEDIAEYYESHSADFMMPEQVSVDYIVLDKTELGNSIAISESDIQEAYGARVAQLEEEAKDLVTASMILLETSDARDEAKAMTEAGDLKVKLDSGADFAKLAKEFSDDPESAAKGGSLGIVETGFFGDAFDSALAGLKEGEVSAPVVADFGVVLVRRDNSSAPKIPSLEQMRASLIKELREQAVEPVFVEKSQQLADVSFEASDLAQPAEQFGLKIQSSDLFSRKGGEGIAANQRIVAAAFSDDVLNLGANSDLVELTPEQLVVLRVHDHKKPEQMPLVDVRSSIEEVIRTERGAEQLVKRTEKLIAELKQGKAGQIAKDNGLEWKVQAKALRYSRDVPAQLVGEAFRLPHPGKGQASFGTTVLPNGDQVVIAVRNVVPGTEKLDEQQARMMGATLSLRMGGQLFNEYMRDLRETADVATVSTQEEG
ncbi:SurA N-terminal domain-containing protein [Sansalvadorimonas sp. 2012CJ34-2]|uniref:Periplasmic chaperone PpiD n=1 Tax=Parendozoicomonas callyspongiae TaxID=2942213 RepID=A0ABT0PBS6_9GAMM|nr:SurA N-terminal domain-containing protein [Sansalvadorimonas sp. 2012CJ34-2]MCL6268733.1 SurA N-terminal domain-containing protein [Sansalvadorimonas sp. 2012CJ34-2]